MPFTGYLTPSQIQTLVITAIASDLISVNRSLLLQGILKAYAQGLKKENDDTTQFNLDLVRINETERLADGQAPIVQYLRNCAFQLRIRGRADAAEFEQFASDIGNRVAGLAALPPVAGLREVTRNEAIVGVNDMVNIGFLAAGAAAAKSVARIRVPRFDAGIQRFTASGAPWIMNGTAWMIGPDLMLTNHHVINARLDGENAAAQDDFSEQAKGASVDFDFDKDDSPLNPLPVGGVVASSATLDYALLRLASPPGRPVLKLYPQRLVFTATSYVPLNIIQHPNGDPKRVAMRNNLLTGSDNDGLRYFTDTDYGSSGSPVMDDGWRVVGLHRGARFVTGVNYQGQPTAYVNFGTHIQTILAELQRDHNNLFAEITAN